ncbi:hypothetical protein SAMN05421810_103728 [Amycolatopsis arida]|uniref:MFS transporter n=1 Tax=Amycolatopsis arida TaxID=587909 RepID=A0A1I5TZ66_9PSEU|nr:hypothetical protein CLV69_10329 [Amycolatopsis arida]SFP88352.1 hypothetical protein SAMN05421810_103728 [Amycolatopsis arida]
MRGTLLAGAAAVLAVTAHAAADGGLPNLSLTLLLTALIGWTATALADQARGAPGILAVLGCAQLLMHLVLTELANHHTGTSGGPGMLASHAGATLLTALLLARAEALLLVVAASARRLLPVAWHPAPVPAGPVPRPVPVPTGETPVVSVVLRRVCGRRGPPRRS